MPVEANHKNVTLTAQSLSSGFATSELSDPGRARVDARAHAQEVRATHDGRRAAELGRRGPAGQESAWNFCCHFAWMHSVTDVRAASDCNRMNVVLHSGQAVVEVLTQEDLEDPEAAPRVYLESTDTMTEESM